MNGTWLEHVQKYKLINENNKLKENLHILKKELLFNEYFRKIIMNPFDFAGSIQFFRSVRDFIVPITVSEEMRNNLYPFISEANKLLKIALNDNSYRFYIHSGYRAYNYQKNMYENSDETHKKLIASPGASEHQSGLSIDFGLRKGKKDCDLNDEKYVIAVDILISIAPKYGFILRYTSEKKIFTGFPEEKWHFRYVGEIAPEISKYNLSYEEYIIALFIMDNNISIDEFLKYNLLEKCVGKEKSEMIKKEPQYLYDIANYIESKNEKLRKIR